MSYFVPSFFQKRLLRYALSRLEIIDTDALDLDSLGITWGQRSTFELRDVGLRLENLAKTLQLPPEFEITKACVSVARVTIPADIYASSIVVESEGIHLDLKHTPTKSGSKRQGRKAKDGDKDSGQGDHEKILPSTADIAQSFLESEPVEETAELEAALTSQSSHYISQSDVLSDDGSEESALGLHDGVTLPTFVAGFIKGVVDRLRFNIRDVSVRVIMEVQQDAFQKPSSSVKMKPVTAIMRLGEVSIDGVAPPESQDPALKAGKRLIVFSQLHALLVSDETLFSNYSRFAPPGTASLVSRTSLTKQESMKSQSSQASSFGYDNPLAQSGALKLSSILDDPLEQPEPLEQSRILEKSVSSSNDGRFDDADTDEEYEPGYQIEPQARALGLPNIQPGEDGINASLNEALESSISNNLMDSTSDTPRLTVDMADSIADLPEQQEIPDIGFNEDGLQVSGRNSPALSMSVSTQSFHSFQSDEEGEEEEPSTPIAAVNPSIFSDDNQEDNGIPQESGAASPDRRSSTSSANDSEPSHRDELSESKIFTHEEARSMYQSAMDGAESKLIGHMPGAWSDHGSESILEEKKVVIDDGHERFLQDNEDQSGATPTGSTVLSSSSVGDVGNKDVPDVGKSCTERSRPRLIDPASDIVKNILEIDKIMVWLPPMGGDPPQELSLEARVDPIQRMRESTLAPGQSSVATSSPRIRFADRNRQDSVSSSSTVSGQQAGSAGLDDDSDILKNMKKEAAVEISVSSFQINFDIACGWLLVKVGQSLAQSLNSGPAPDKALDSAADEKQPIPIIVDVSNCSLKLLEHLPGCSYLPWMSNSVSNPLTDSEDALLQVTITGIAFHSLTAAHTMKTRLTVNKFKISHLSEDLLSFDEGLKMRESTRDILSSSSDIIISAVKNSQGSRLTINTLPLHMTVSLQRLDETLTWLGGLSTIIELGNSIASGTTATGGPQEPGSKPRGVRFEQTVNAPKEPPSTADSAAWKLDSRIGGVVIHVLGEQCSVKLETSAVKSVKRSEGIAVQVDRVRATGPHFYHYNINIQKCSPALVALDNVRFEFLFTPKESDLDRLLTLLAPSKSKYDEEDDIMIDTLLRQRRQGSVLRLTVGGLTANVYSLSAMKPLSLLAEEASKLARVAKYLPEDDRPGMLALALVRELELNITVGGKVGKFRLQSHNAEVGYVSFPSLIASRVSTATVLRNEKEELLGPAVLRKPGERKPESELPMFMVRYIADELEPAIKLKLFNTRVEYIAESIVTLMDLQEDEATTEGIATNMAQSVLNFAELPEQPTTELETSMQDSTAADPSPGTTSPIRLSVTLKDCLIGLAPRNSPAKGYVVLTNVEFFGCMQQELRSEATLKVAKASMMVVDRVESEEKARSNGRRRRSTSLSPQVQYLEEIGYVSVCETSSAQIYLKIMQLAADGQKSLDVEVRDDLLILETCADSTQSLISLLSGLSPPAPPSEAVKYRTEVMPISNLLQSFAAETLDTFNSNKKSSREYDGLEESDEISAAELGYISDFFPFHASVKSGKSTEEAPGEGYELLAKSTHSVAHVHPEHTALNFDEDHFSKNSAVGGTAHRWDASRNTYNLSNEVNLQNSPLRLRVRDVHVIWNLYDGYDWWRTRDTISKSVKSLQTRAAERRARATNRRLSREMEEEMEPTIDDFLFNSVYIEIPSNKDPRDLTSDINRNIDGLSETGSYATTSTITGTSTQDGVARREKLRLARSQHHKMTIELKGVSADVVVFPANSGETQSSIDVRIHDLEIFDHMPTSTWRKFATYMHDMGEREIGTSMVHVEVLNVKPVADLAASEIILKATVLPLRLHVDHDALDFMARFFDFKDESASKPETAPGDVPFLQRVEINPIPIRLDFKPKRLDYTALRSGRTTELMNIFVLDEADMVLRHVILYGITGFERLGKMLNDIWTPDVRDNQLGGVLSGLAPVKSLVTLGSGVRDLIFIPIREYKKDGRIVRGLQKGAAAFAKTTTSELIKIGAKLAIGTQNVLQGAEGYLNGPPPQPANRAPSSGEDPEDDEPIDVGAKQQISLYADQPVGVIQGLRGAYAGLGRDLSVARDAIIAVPGEIMETENVTEAARAALRSAPTIILGPAISAAGAVGETLLGARNTLDPENKRRADEV
ncbi:autophagy regulatory protein Atg2, putative [Trichophyton benhamiae CBS 112371]|uniref:Autophagy-related protein 2 n=1 Tax=Arthroderma benhamiae (strain ATCC MYA-4681 / CBS 112371) TaxID=663331 RepID=D4ATG6_ARTBC|nr:autophagy regulatory protein Atg2, putative [Trichophyton benhamiae CBS 112371]EFE33585.1 autophagy regulatory protein Atg2, putative [Trichophyton benhamiae CBS 112371]